MRKIVIMQELFGQAGSPKDTIINGVVRRGEIMNVCASPKIGKSWLMLQLAISVSLGMEWLGFQTSKGRVLYINNELHHEAFSARIKHVLKSMKVQDGEVGKMIDVVMARGDSEKEALNDMIMSRRGESEYSLIIVDAFYKILKKNDDQDEIKSTYCILGDWADKFNAAVAVVKHSQKLRRDAGHRRDDSGSFIGSIQADTNLIIREGVEPNHYSMDVATRSFAPINQSVIGFKFPLWSKVYGEGNK